MSQSVEGLLEAVAEVARITGDVALRYYVPDVAVETKSDGSPVTEADRRAERVAREWIGQRFPGDTVLGEEYGSAAGSGTRRWILDPIDGTKSYVRHVPLWGTLVAVEEDGEVLAGAAYFPAVGELLAAARGAGCFLNGVRARVSDTASLEHATVLVTDDRFPDRPERRAAWSVLASQSGVVRTWGDAYGYLMVATGRADVMLDDITNPWDSAPVMPLVLEAGGVFTDFAGNATPFGGSAIATNAALAAQVHAIMQDSPKRAV